jgi:hypothetical protein
MRARLRLDGLGGRRAWVLGAAGRLRALLAAQLGVPPAAVEYDGAPREEPAAAGGGGRRAAAAGVRVDVRVLAETDAEATRMSRTMDVLVSSRVRTEAGYGVGRREGEGGGSVGGGERRVVEVVVVKRRGSPAYRAGQGGRDTEDVRLG